MVRKNPLCLLEMLRNWVTNACRVLFLQMWQRGDERKVRKTFFRLWAFSSHPHLRGEIRFRHGASWRSVTVSGESRTSRGTSSRKIGVNIAIDRWTISIFWQWFCFCLTGNKPYLFLASFDISKIILIVRLIRPVFFLRISRKASKDFHSFYLIIWK